MPPTISPVRRAKRKWKPPNPSNRLKCQPGPANPTNSLAQKTAVSKNQRPNRPKNWLYGPTKAQKEAGLEHPAIDYLSLTPIQELKVKKYRRTIPWNMVSEAEHYIHNEERNIGTLGALARMEDVEKWITAVKAAGGEPYVSFDMECGYVPKGDKPPNEHTLTEWDTPGKDKVENEADDHKCTEAPTKAEYMKAVEAFLSHAVLNE